MSFYLRISLVPSKILKILRSRMIFSRPKDRMYPFPPRILNGKLKQNVTKNDYLSTVTDAKKPKPRGQ